MIGPRPIHDDEYHGPRFRYGLTYRPVGLSNIPSGSIVKSDRPHPGFRFGTIDYPFPLDDFTVGQLDLDPVPIE
jgi:hypothetical protein